MFKTVLFQTRLPIGANVSAQEIIAADFTGDGVPDLFIPTLNYVSDGSRSPLLFLAGSADGTFTDASARLFGGSTPTAVYAARVVTSDFNGDGKPDIFVLDSGPDKDPFPGGQNRLLLSTPTSFIDATSNLPTLMAFNHGAAVGDVNNDGKIDVVVFALNAYGSTTPNSGPAIQILEGDGTGGFSLVSSALPAIYQQPGYSAGSTWGALVDVNRDGFADLVVGTWSVSNRPTELYLNDGRGSFQNAEPISLPAVGLTKEIVLQVVGADVNGDGIPDLILSVTNGGQGGDLYTIPYIQLLIGNGTGHFRDETQARLPQSATPSASGSWDKFLSLIDVDGDGSLDIVASNESASKTTVYRNDGSGHYSPMSDVLPADAAPLYRGSSQTPYAFAALGGSGLQILSNDAPAVYASAAISNVLRVPAAYSPATSQLLYSVASGSQTLAAIARTLGDTAGTTTSVATLSYQFFTGHTPTAAGLDYLISPTSVNTNNINSAYYQFFTVENRYINFAVNLGKLGEGAAAFGQAYGNLSLTDATKLAYGTIFGTTPTDAKVAAILTAPTGIAGIATRADYFAYYGQDGSGGVGTKAAMVGYLLVEAVKADVGTFQTANLAYLTDLALGHVSGSVDLVGVYHGTAYLGG